MSRAYPSLVLSLAVLAAVLTGCVKETSRGDAFEASAEMSVQEFSHGDEVRLVLRTNRSSVLVTAFSFEPAPSLVEPGRTYQVPDGVLLLTARAHVARTHDGELSLTLQDTGTGAQQEFRFPYRAFAPTGASLTVDNPPLETVSPGMPAVVGADPLRVTIRSRAERLVVKELRSEWETPSLAEGTELTFDGDGLLSLSINHPPVMEDETLSPRTIALTLHNRENGRDTTLAAQYVKVKAFSAFATLSPASIIDGNRVTLRLSANRGRFTLTDLSAPSWMREGLSLSTGEVETGPGGYREFAGTVCVPAAERGELQFLLTDSGYTQRDTLLRVPFSAAPKPDPETVVLDGHSFVQNTGEYLRIGVSTPEVNTTERFLAEVSSSDRGKLGLYAPSASETAAPGDIAGDRYGASAEITSGRLYVHVGDHSGTFTLRVWPKGHPDRARSVSVRVRTDVALRLKGRFHFYGETGRRGWFGFPQEVTAELVTYRVTGGGSVISTFDSSIALYSLGSAYTGGLKVSFLVSVSNSVRANHFYRAYKHLEYPPRDVFWYDHDWKWTTMPDRLNTAVAEAKVTGPVVVCTNLLGLLQDMDGNALEWCHDSWNDHSVPYDDSAGFGTFRIDVTEVVYDSDLYHLRYVLNLFEVPQEWGEQAPWWAALPPERAAVIPWIQ